MRGSGRTNDETCTSCFYDLLGDRLQLIDLEDTTTPSGKLTFHIFGALAEFERQLIQERTQAGLRVARARGRVGGRPKALAAEKRQWAVQLYQEKKIAVKHICELMGISKPTLYAYVRQAQSSS